MEPSFSVLDVLGDAWGSYRRSWSAHLRWNVGFVALAVGSTCAMGCITMPIAALAGGGDPGSSVVAVGIVYVLMLVVMTGLFAMHQGVTLEIAASERRGETPHVATCVGEAGNRLPAVAGTLVLRILIDFAGSVVTLGGPIAAFAAVRATGDETPDPAESVGILLALVIGYVAYLGWLIVIRSFVGLSGPCAQLEKLGPVSAIARSAALLRGHRLRLIGTRLAWALIAIGVYVAVYAPVVVIALVSGLLGAASGSSDASSLVALLLFPYILFVYLVLLHLLTFDSLIEGAFHARLTHAPSVEELADVFA